MQADELAASRLEAQTRCDAAESAQRDSAAQLSGAEARAAKASAAVEAAEHTAQHLRGEMQAAQSNLAALEKQSSEKGTALAVVEGNCEDLRKQLAAVEQEREAFRCGQVRTTELEGVATQSTCACGVLLAQLIRSCNIEQRVACPGHEACAHTCPALHRIHHRVLE